MAVRVSHGDPTPEERRQEIEHIERNIRPIGIPPEVEALLSEPFPENDGEPTPSEPARLLIEGDADALALLADLAQRLGLAVTHLPENPEQLPDKGTEATEQQRPEAENIGWAKGSVYVGPDLFKDDNVR